MGIEARRFIMIDVETSGPVYGHHSLLELGAAVGSREQGITGTFSALLRPISEHVSASRQTYAAARANGEAPSVVMERFRAWSAPHQERGADFIARPSAFDWPWIVYYAWTYLHENPFGFKAICASSWLEASGERFRVKIPHVAARDAEIQLAYFLDHLGPRAQRSA